MKLYRPKIGVGPKTWIALSVVFWIPVAGLAGILFYLFQNTMHEDVLTSINIHLKGARGIYEERVKVVEGLMSHISSQADTRDNFDAKDSAGLQKLLLEIGKKNPYLDIIAAVDETQRVIGRRNNQTGDIINVGDTLSRALNTGENLNSTEVVSVEFLSREEKRLSEHVKDIGIIQFVVTPVRSKGKVVGALVAGILLTGDPWLGNTVSNRLGVEMALFAGTPPESSFLHSTSSTPRKTWMLGQTIPAGLNEEISLGKPFNSILNIEGVDNLVAFEPIMDSRNRIIGALGVSTVAKEVNAIVIRTIATGVIAASLLGLLISAVLTFFIRGDITRPLEILVDAMENFGRGNLNVSVDLQTGDQFEKLGAGFNVMVTGIRKREERLKKHNDVAKLLMSTLDLKELLEKMLKIVVDVTESQMGIVYLIEEGGNTLVPRVQYGTKAELATLKVGEGYPGRAAKDNRTFKVCPPQVESKDETHEPMELGFTRVVPSEVAYIPLSFQNQTLGVLVLGSSEKYREEEAELFDYLGNQISIALDNAIMHNKIQELSITDALTGLFNRRYLNSRLDKIWSGSVRHNRSISILLSDVDNFKSVNDTYGHDMGDEVLKHIAEVFKGCTRNEDVAARYGGEEFVVVLTDADSKASGIFAERLREKVKEKEFPWMGRAVTMSIGVATFPEVKAEDYEALIQLADQAMYKAKATGKDKVVAASNGSEASEEA